MEDQGKDSPNIEQIRKSRNRVLALSLAAFVILVFFISIAKMS
ncbi:hypothetical protein [Novosphingobium mangrovi (ex Huang et al. 2023)]|uniref:Protoheme IX farnesyltransferase n=1 Tax=Novosphingobium mangrovi (ex Huang et al. 2023) TaxID=2976432 RepID=A0ABT2I0G1_9SPHN|nr:hypothetical protein [Novosphingobium mangrovi (ex Huang et al. 2023)]MCT2398289.1 hypothetical protein [Novosphingobium mangrovi (ex Huang et al. 2023)]